MKEMYVLMRNKHKIFKSGLSLALALVMCVGLLSVTAFAQTDKETKGNGKGQFCQVCGTRLWQTSGGKGQSGGKYCPNCDAKKDTETPDEVEIPDGDTPTTETPETTEETDVTGTTSTVETVETCDHIWDYESLSGTGGHMVTKCLLCDAESGEVEPHNYGEWKLYEFDDSKDVNYCLDCMYRTFRTHYCQWGSPIVNADGSTTYTCTLCTKTMTETPETPAHVHQAGDWTVVKDATCTEDGRWEKHCDECGEFIAAQIFYATGHTPEWVITKVPKGTRTGKAEYKCSACGEVLETAELPNFVDESVWTLVGDVGGYRVYTSMYGEITVQHN